MADILSNAAAEAVAQMNVVDDWPVDDAVLFEPCENEQVLMYEYAECLATRTFLRLADLPFRIEHRPNAQFISPSGKVPFLRVHSLLVAEFEPIVELVGRKGIRLSENLPPSEQADMQATMCCIQERLYHAEIWCCWMHEAARTKVTNKRYGSVYPWPLNVILPYQKYRQMNDYLKLVNWADKTADQVLSCVDNACKALNVQLGDQLYLCGDQATELDALAFGHLYTLLTTDMPDMDFAQVVKRYPKLMHFVQLIEDTCFKSVPSKPVHIGVVKKR